MNRDQVFTDSELLAVYAMHAGRMPCKRWLNYAIADGVHARTVHGRPGQRGGRSRGTFSGAQVRLAEIIAALEAADGDGAAQAMETHLDYVLRHSTEYPKHHDPA